MVAFKLNALVVFIWICSQLCDTVFLHDARVRGVPITVSSVEAQELLSPAFPSSTQ
jgi:hypothetical protein